MLTREEFPSWSTYSKTFDDIEACCLNSSLLISIDQSVNFKNISSTTVDQINVVIPAMDISLKSLSASALMSIGDSDCTSKSVSITLTNSTSNSEILR